jgi:hypothetical protein
MRNGRSEQIVKAVTTIIGLAIIAFALAMANLILF